MDAATDNHGGHRENHGPQHGRKCLRLELLGPLDELGAFRVVDYQFLHLLTGPNKEEHGHALRQCDEKGRKEAVQEMIPDIRRTVDCKTQPAGVQKAKNGK
jgi:hypothetical protein